MSNQAKEEHNSNPVHLWQSLNELATDEHNLTRQAFQIFVHTTSGNELTQEGMNLSLSDITHIGNHQHPCWHSASDTGVTARLSPALYHLGKDGHPTATSRLASCRSGG